MSDNKNSPEDELVERFMQGFLKRFNVERVEMVMRLVNWKYMKSTTDHETYFPDKAKLIQTVRYLVRRCIQESRKPEWNKEAPIVCSTGGFDVSSVHCEGNDPHIMVKFVLCEYESETSCIE